MSEETPRGLIIAEKFVGLLISIIGFLIVYITYTDPPGGILTPFYPFFIIGGVLVLGIGAFLVLVKTE